jgi:poly-gamma-glutamate capsule biosynthesis protein CapA/YwtB (metallophosphatase superfamily)
MERELGHAVDRSNAITLFLAGDVMTGRGIDQILPHPVDPRIHESHMKSAVGYVDLAQRINGPIPRPADFSYVWGEALEEIDRAAPDARVVNLETAVTASEDYWKDKGINYRMHPENVGCITAARIDCCVLANNHLLDWGYAGLEETLEALKKANVKSAGAGRNLHEAASPAIVEVAGKGRVVVFSFGSETGGVPRAWAAAPDGPGVNFLDDLSEKTVRRIAEPARHARRPGDVVVLSLHWGGNWGYEIPDEQIAFAHRLIDEAGADVIHGHSSHHPKGIEIYHDKAILYGCGDLLNDYEGIAGYEEFRGDLGLMYFPCVDVATGKLVRFRAIPMRVKRFSLNRASDDEARWLSALLNRESERFGVRAELTKGNTLALRRKQNASSTKEIKDDPRKTSGRSDDAPQRGHMADRSGADKNAIDGEPS